MSSPACIAPSTTGRLRRGHRLGRSAWALAPRIASAASARKQHVKSCEDDARAPSLGRQWRGDLRFNLEVRSVDTTEVVFDSVGPAGKPIEACVRTRIEWTEPALTRKKAARG